MTEDQKIKIRRFMELKANIHTLDEEADTLKQEVTVTIFNELGRKGKVQGQLGTLSMSLRKKWTYPQDVLEAESVLKAMKDKAEASGAAQFDEVPSVMFKRAKNDGSEGDEPIVLEV